jgi:hypothetical protein
MNDVDSKNENIFKGKIKQKKKSTDNMPSHKNLDQNHKRLSSPETLITSVDIIV